jgi:hypothetical protein
LISTKTIDTINTTYAGKIDGDEARVACALGGDLRQTAWLAPGMV